MKIVLFVFIKIFISMKKNIVLIKESQYRSLQKHLAESQVYTRNINVILKDLVQHYEPLITSDNNGFEFNTTKKIKKKVDGTVINPAQLLDYFINKFPDLNNDFIKQIISDWYNGKFSDDLSLSRNVPIN